VLGGGGEPWDDAADGGSGRNGLDTERALVPPFESASPVSASGLSIARLVGALPAAQVASRGAANLGR
jgi:hypothetical protein